MATFNWFGGYGRYSGSRHWDPQAAPGQGDVAAVAGGEVVLRRQEVGATVLLGSPDAGLQPALDLRDASLNAMAMPSDLPTQPYKTQASLVEYATINVRGHSSIGMINAGNFANMVRAPDPYGHGALTAPGVLNVNLGGHAALDAGFDVKEGSTLTVNGGSGSSLNAANSAVEGGRVVINAPLAGQGTITMTNGAVEYYGAADTGRLELAGGVGDGVTVDIRMGDLQIDKPLEFAGSIDLRASEHDPAASYDNFGPQSVTLKGIASTAYSFDDATHTMTLYNGDAPADQVRFTPDIVAASFGATYSGIRVVQGSDGVLLRGQYAGDPAGTSYIPLHA